MILYRLNRNKISSSGVRSSSIRGAGTYRGFKFNEIRNSSNYYASDSSSDGEIASSEVESSGNVTPTDEQVSKNKEEFGEFLTDNDSESSGEIEMDSAHPQGYVESRTTTLTPFCSNERSSRRRINGLRKSPSPL